MRAGAGLGAPTWKSSRGDKILGLAWERRHLAGAENGFAPLRRRRSQAGQGTGHFGLRALLAVGFVLCVLCFNSSLAHAAPARIVSLAPSVTESVFALGLGDRLVGVSVYCDYPPGVEKIDRVGTFLTPNIEAILAKRPDIVLGVPSPGNRGPVEELRRLGVRVVVVDPTTIDEIKQAQIDLGIALDVEAAAHELVRGIDARIERVGAALRDVPERKVLMVVGQTPLIAVGRGTYLDELIRLAHGINLGAAAGGSWPRLSIEFAIAAGPEVIIDTTMGNEEQTGAAASLDFWKSFATIPAVKNGRVHGYKQYQLLRPGPRLPEALETIARIIHPEAFSESGAPSR